MALVTIKTEPESTNSLLQVCRLCLSEDSLDDVFKKDGLQQWLLSYLSITVSTEDYLSQAICAACRLRLTEFHQFHMRCQKVQEVLEFLNQNENIETESAQLFLKDMLNYGCIKCGKMFVLRQHLEKHKQIHVIDEDMISEPEELQAHETDASSVTGAVVDQEFIENTESQNLPFAFISAQLATKRVKNLAKAKPKAKKIHRKMFRAKIEKEGATDLVEDMIDIEEIKVEAHTDDDDDVKLSNGMLEKITSISNEVDANKSNNASIEESNNVGFIQSDQNNSNARQKKKEECELCHRKYANKLLLWSHHRLAHGPRNYKCKVCDVSFTTNQRLKSHSKSSKHLNNLRHESQKQSGKGKSNKTEHKQEGNDGASEHSVVKVVNNDAEYSCAVCNRSFKRECQFKSHMRSHEIEAEKSSDSEGTGNEEVVSDGSEYTSKSDQPLETKEVIQDSSVITSNTQPFEEKKVDNEKPFKCVSCHKSYDTATQLQNHKGRHRPKKYICPICGKPFNKMYPLEMHIPSHNAVRDWHRNRSDSTTRDKNVEKPHKCDICQTSFRTGSGLIGHKKQVHGPKIHECHLCPYKFATRKELRRHVNRHYGSNRVVV